MPSGHESAHGEHRRDSSGPDRRSDRDTELDTGATLTDIHEDPDRERVCPPRWRGLAVTCLLAFGMYGCASSASPGKIVSLPSGETHFAPQCILGKAMGISDQNASPGFTVEVTTTIAQRPASNTSSSAASTSGEYEVVTVKIVGHEGSYLYSPNNFNFLTSAGQTFQPVDEATLGGRFGPALGTGTVTPGKETSGTIVFDVPKGGGQLGIVGVKGLKLCEWHAPK